MCLLLTRMPGHSGGLFLVTSESLNLLLRVPDVEQLEQVVARGRQQPVAVRVPPGTDLRIC
jgi:hypothetical protein